MTPKQAKLTGLNRNPTLDQPALCDSGVFAKFLREIDRPGVALLIQAAHSASLEAGRCPCEGGKLEISLTDIAIGVKGTVMMPVSTCPVPVSQGTLKRAQGTLRTIDGGLELTFEEDWDA